MKKRKREKENQQRERDRKEKKRQEERRGLREYQETEDIYSVKPSRVQC